MLLLSFINLISCIYATEYWVSPDGNDNNDGKSEMKAFASPNKATSVAAAGDMIWVKGGEYMISTSITCSKAGTASAPIKMWAVPGEIPVFNCQPLIDGGKTSNSGRGMQLSKNYWHIKGIVVCNTNDRGITIGTSSGVTGVILEGVIVHHANNDGIAFMAGCSNALVLNCDSHHNWERDRDGNNGDGFAAKAGDTGNVFRGCRAWNNSDDGWDVYGGASPVLIDSCWSFHNGYNVFGYSGAWKGNGNGFKLGGTAVNAEHVVTNSVAFGNRSKGFDQNHATKGQTVIHCTGYDNQGENGNFSFYEEPTDGILRKHIMKNNLSYKGLTHKLASGTEEVTNSWNLGITFTDADFLSVDTTLATLSRNANYHLTDATLFRLKKGNPAIEQGTPVSVTFNGQTFPIPYKGTSPDLGAFSFQSSTSTGTGKTGITYLSPYVDSSGNIVIDPQAVFVEIYNSNGFLVKTGNTNRINLGKVTPGIYLIRITNEEGNVNINKVAIK